MRISVPLTQTSVNRPTVGFGDHPDDLNGLLSAAQTSPYLAGLINAYVAKGRGQIGTGTASNAADTSPDGNTIFIGVSLLPSTTTVSGVTQSTGEPPPVLATLLGHELEHALLPGGMGDADGQSTNATLAADVRLKNIRDLAAWDIDVREPILGLAG